MPVHQRLRERVDRMPHWLRPAMGGVVVLAALMVQRGALIIAPIALVCVFIFSPHPLHDIAFGSVVLLAAVVGAGLAGLAYGVSKRWLVPLPLGRSLGGMLTSAPYFLLISFAIGYDKADARHPLWFLALFTAGIMTLIFGPLIGRSLFAPDAAPKGGDPSRR